MLAPDDIKVGDIVTVLDGRPQNVEVKDADGSVAIQQIVRPNFCGAGFRGKILEVLAIDLPYVIVRQMGYDYRHSLDLREVELKRPSPAYLAAMKGGGNA